MSSIEASLDARPVLHLVCGKCTREAIFRGADQIEAAQTAKKEGWAKQGDKMVCPKCPAPRSGMLPASVHIDRETADDIIARLLRDGYAELDGEGKNGRFTPKWVGLNEAERDDILTPRRMN